MFDTQPSRKSPTESAAQNKSDPESQLAVVVLLRRLSRLVRPVVAVVFLCPSIRPPFSIRWSRRPSKYYLHALLQVYVFNRCKISYFNLIRWGTYKTASPRVDPPLNLWDPLDSQALASLQASYKTQVRKRRNELVRRA